MQSGQQQEQEKTKAAPAPPADIPGIQVQCELGSGGFAVVYGGIDGAGRPVAVKVFKTGSDDAIRLYQREVKVATMLPESAYRPVFYYSDVLQDGRPYFVMEWIQGSSLIDRLLDGWRPSIQEACKIIVDACAGLESLHELGLVHSDVKPGNIIIASDGRGVIIDFGLVADAEGLVSLMETEKIVRGREFSTDISEPMLAGTPRYFAPEQIAYALQETPDEPLVDTATDVYALGAILYEMVARRPLWPMSKPITDREAMRKYVEMRTSGVEPETPIPKNVQPTLAGLIRRCVRHELRDRPRTAKDMRNLLRRFLEGRAVALDNEATPDSVSSMEGRGPDLFPMKTIRRQIDWAKDAPVDGGMGLALVDTRNPKGTTPSPASQPGPQNKGLDLVESAEAVAVESPPQPQPQVVVESAPTNTGAAPKGPPVWLYNAIWAALGASLALAALAVLFDW